MSHDKIIDLPINMKYANERIEIYKGDFVLKNQNDSFRFTGEIFLNWVPNIRIIFRGQNKGELDVRRLVKSENLVGSKHTNLYLKKVGVCQAIVSRWYNTNSEVEIEGMIIGDFVLGDKSMTIEKLSFCIPNLKKILGESVEKTMNNHIYLALNRLTLSNEEYTINIDIHIDYSERYMQLERNGGFMLLAAGELVPINGKFDRDKVKEILNIVGEYLSFINGCRIAPMFLTGFIDGEKVWTDYSPKKNDSFSNRYSWYSENVMLDFNVLWKNFTPFYVNQTDKDFLSTSLHWYFESNSNSVYAESGIILAQTNLELIYNWMVYEKDKDINMRKNNRIHTSEKIRVLLSVVECSTIIPSEFKNLERYRQINKLNDGPETIVNIRNALVHSEFKKRRKMEEVDALTRFEALHQSIWYAEVALLRILKYKGSYFNRCTRKVEQL